MYITHIVTAEHGSAIRIPPELGLYPGDEVEIIAQGNEWLIRKPNHNLLAAFNALTSLPDDFMAEGRQDENPPLERASLDMD